jgi:WXXGXW repeat (2 copies)
MKKAMAVMMLLAGGLCAAPRIQFGIGFRTPAPVAVVRPACPGPGYTWTDGYYASNGAFVAGYWAPPVVERIAPRYVAPRYDHARVVERRFDDHRGDDRRGDDHRVERFRR